MRQQPYKKILARKSADFITSIHNEGSGHEVPGSFFSFLFGSFFFSLFLFPPHFSSMIISPLFLF